MKTIETETIKALEALKAQHRSNWTAFNSKLSAILDQVGARNTEENITNDVTAEDFVAIGYTDAEADALMFVLTEDCMGQSVNNLELIERWFCYCA